MAHPPTGPLNHIALVHPCRALVMFADNDGDDSDIEMHVASRCQIGRGASGQHLLLEAPERRVEAVERQSGRYRMDSRATASRGAVRVLVAGLGLRKLCAGRGHFLFKPLLRDVRIRRTKRRLTACHLDS